MRRVRVKVAEEYSILEGMLAPLTRPQHVGEYAASLRRLREAHRPTRSRPRVAELAPRPASKPDEKLIKLIGGRSLTGKDIDSWIQINVISVEHPYDVMAKVDAVLDDMIQNAGPTALWALMQYLAKYWEVGIMGERPLIRTARRHAELVLLRALQVSHKTTFAHGASDRVAELVGLPQIDKFDRFIVSLFEYLQIERSATSLDKLDDLLFRLHARCGAIAETQKRAKQLADNGLYVSGNSTQELLSTLSRWFEVERDSASINVAEFRHKVRLDLEPLQDMLSADITPGSLRFMLVWLESVEELWSLLSIADRSDQRRRIYRECQVDLVRTIERLGLAQAQPTLMAQATGLVARIAENAALTPEFYECWLLACAKAGNVAAVSRVLEQLPNLSEQVLSELLDAFPMSPSPESVGLVERIRSRVPESLRHKWVAALHRAGGDVEKEWAQASQIPHLLRSSDVLLAFFSALPAGSPGTREILAFALESEFRTHIIEELRAHELMDALELNRAVARFAMDHPELDDHQVDAMLPGLANAHQITRVQEAELIFP